MNFNEKLAAIKRANDRRAGISDAKGPEYAGQSESYRNSDADVLRNFKRQGERWDVDPIKVAAVYFGKHIDSIETFVRDLIKADTYTEKLALVTKGEGIVSRLDDARNYIDLLECLMYDANLHPEKIDRELVANHELLEEAAKIDWSEPGYSMKVEIKDTFDAPKVRLSNILDTPILKLPKSEPWPVECAENLAEAIEIDSAAEVEIPVRRTPDNLMSWLRSKFHRKPRPWLPNDWAEVYRG